jgi:hypothetical protein
MCGSATEAMNVSYTMPIIMNRRACHTISGDFLQPQGFANEIHPLLRTSPFAGWASIEAGKGGFRGCRRCSEV